MKRRITTGWELTSLQRQIDELLELLARSSAADQGGWSPSVDIVEHEKRFLVRVDLPGVTEDALEISVRDRVLLVSGDKPRCQGDPCERRYHHMERGFGRFAVEVALPGPVRPDGARARLRLGVLEVDLPRIEDRRATVYRIPLTDEEP